MKKRVVYVLLAVFLGYFGIHNFYAGYTGRAIAQLILGLTVIGLVVTGPWSLIEALVVNKLPDGQLMS